MFDALKRKLLTLTTYRSAPERILENPFVSAKRLLPLEAGKGYHIIPNFKTSPP